MLQNILVLTATMISLNAFAIDTARCPKSISLQGTTYKMHADSRYSSVPGWKDAQENLAENPEFESYLQLTSNANGRCVYEDQGQIQAILSTASFHDREEREPTLSDRLTVQFKIDNSIYVTYVGVMSYNRNQIVLYGQNSTSAQKIKTRLYVNETKRWANFDLGMIRVSAH